MSAFAIETEGRRHYLTGNTYPLRDKLRALGAHWDGDRKAWWTSKRAALESLIAAAPVAPAAYVAPVGEALIAIDGNTYPVRDQLRAMGGSWDAGRKAWMVPASKADAARALVATAPKQSFVRRGGSSRRRGTWTGCRCGSVEEYSKDSDCWTCKHDAM